MHWIRHTTLTWVERNFGYAVAKAYAGHTDNGGDGGRDRDLRPRHHPRGCRRPGRADRGTPPARHAGRVVISLAALNVGLHRSGATAGLGPKGRPAAWTPDQPEGTGPPRAPPASGPSGPGRCWSWPPRPRPRCGPAGSASRRRPGSGWSPRCRASGRRCTWTRPSPCPSAWRRTPPTRCAPGWQPGTRSVTGPAGSPSGPRSAPSLGMAGQVAYHLLAQAGAARAPWPVTTIVSCLPVLVLAMGTTLAHMLRADATPGSGTRGPVAYRPPLGPTRIRLGHPRTRPRALGHPPKPVLPPGQQRSRGRTTAPARGPRRRVRPRPARHA